MPKRGCLNCHFFCNVVIDLDLNAPVIKSVDAKYRDREAITEFLNRDRPFTRVRSIKCFCGNWDSEKIGKDNITEIIGAIFIRERNKCLHFSVYDQYATPDAVRDREKKKLEIIDRRVTRIMAVIALFIAFGSMAVAYFKP